jgi:hypothetical protein
MITVSDMAGQPSGTVSGRCSSHVATSFVFSLVLFLSHLNALVDVLPPLRSCILMVSVIGRMS